MLVNDIRIILIVGATLVFLSGHGFGSDGRCCSAPNSIGEAILHLDECLSEEEKTEIKVKNRGQVDDLLYTHGLEIRNNWELWRESRLTRQFAANGIYLDRDITYLIIDIYWKHLNGQPLDLKDSVSELRKRYDELAKHVDSSGIVFGTQSEIIPIPNPESVTDQVIELPKH